MATNSPPAYRELTFAALALGVIQGAILTASFVYIGLKLGFGLSGSTVAAITGFALLRGVGRKIFNIEGCGSILETNINQTIASGINTASAGVVFTFPALFLLGFADEINYSVILLAAVAGSFMGIVVIIPLRKQMIEIERLRFPSGIAVATILKSPGAGAQKAVLLGVGAVIAASMTLLSHFEVMPETLKVGSWFLEDPATASGSTGILLLGTSLSLSMANFGAGLLSGKGGLAFAVGGMLAWWVIAPYVAGQGWIPEDIVGDELWGTVYGTMLRPVGIGILIGGALSGVVMSYPALKGAIKSLKAAAKLAKTGNSADAEELPPKVLVFGLVGSFIALFVVAILGSEGAVAMSISVAVAGTIWLALAGLIVAQATGATDISPLSGLALIAVTLMLAITANNVMLAVTIGVAVCVATNQCSDMMSDLKTGHLVGGQPRRQQLAQFMVAWIGPAIAIGTVVLLWKGGPGGENGFGPGTDLGAPQAGALQGMVEGVVTGNAPLDKYFAGACIGGALALFPVSGLGVLIGLAMYLPFEITFAYGIGCVASMGLEKWKGRSFYGGVIVPIGAGFIIGEALTSLTLTMIALASGGGQ
ncbi:MAG: putative OPT family oligopeptide transporter [Polyangiales bacterium]|jgi:putative OPT family oligopeptide transporter